MPSSETESSDNEEYEQIHAKVPKDTKELAKRKLEHGGITRVVREELERVAHGEEAREIERVQDNLDDLREERRKKKRERDNIESDLDEIERKIERAERRLNKLRDKKGEYQGMLKMIEEQMRENGMAVDPGHKQVLDAAEAGNCSPEDVITDLQDRNQDIDDDRFRYTEQ